MAIPRGVRLLVIIVACLTIELLSVDGRKCVCTSKPCLEAGVDTCRTRFFCYTEVILNDEDQGNTTTLGCTEPAMPVLCEGPSMGHLQVISLRCCDSHDYCNGEVPASPTLQQQDHRKPGTSTLTADRSDPVANLTGTRADLEKPSDPPDRYHDKKPLDSTSSASTTPVCSNVLSSLTTHQVKPLHVAALVLTVAAIISVFAACYVINSFLRSHRHHPAAAVGAEEIRGPCECRCRSESLPDQNPDFGINIRNDLQKIKS